ncbi:MAG: formate dehydrogenase accessory sulfurtransferase FdhD [Pseudomonas sp.]|uniref:formate dehydrogenase accessory sulfurtransferase FdhD n=1 Tax=Halopseudomonas laoshanensis TaxID=2268758 RepID=UPI001B776EB1|nr:formate dehydrogenase accessory sulfurtransferase FdhD [Pseudomonas sp.]MBQ0778413.1 formate dehydrogenase accessory sulfurtransferase FdhD [Pseudomonas sp.]
MPYRSNPVDDNPHPLRYAAVATAGVANRQGFIELDANGSAGATVLAEECALALSYNGIAQAVMMVSPHDLEDFVFGFSLSNGLVGSTDEIFDLVLSGEGGHWQAGLQISSRAFHALTLQRRHLAGSSGCGLCGVESMALALPNLTPLSRSGLPPLEHLADLRGRIAQAQQLARASGAMHAALYVDEQGAITLCREDIGRHNALDKLIGALYRQQIDYKRGFVAVTSRCSLELIHKAIRAQLPTLVSLSAPTALSVDWAIRHGLNLIHMPHSGAPRLYTPQPTRDLA